MHKMMIEAAINELASKEDNPNVPYSPEDIARDAVACIEAGATIPALFGRAAPMSIATAIWCISCRLPEPMESRLISGYGT